VRSWYVIAGKKVDVRLLEKKRGCSSQRIGFMPVVLMFDRPLSPILPDAERLMICDNLQMMRPAPPFYVGQNMLHSLRINCLAFGIAGSSSANAEIAVPAAALILTHCF
jgi:hypothetical protein